MFSFQCNLFTPPPPQRCSAPISLRVIFLWVCPAPCPLNFIVVLSIRQRVSARWIHIPPQGCIWIVTVSDA